MSSRCVCFSSRERLVNWNCVTKRTWKVCTSVFNPSLKLLLFFSNEKRVAKKSGNWRAETVFCHQEMWVTIQNIFLDKQFLGSQSQIFCKFEYSKFVMILMVNMRYLPYQSTKKERIFTKNSLRSIFVRSTRNNNLMSLWLPSMPKLDSAVMK